MARIRSSATAVPDLSSGTISILLAGWGAKPPKGMPRQHGFGGGFIRLAIEHEAGAAALWRQHEGYLRHVAREWGWQPTVELPNGGLGFFGEAAAADERRGRERAKASGGAIQDPDSGVREW